MGVVRPVHYRDYGNTTVYFTFICCSCGRRFQATAPQKDCDNCGDNTHGEMSGS